MSSGDESAREEQARSNLDALKLSSDEVSKFETAFKDPAFKQMFAEYAAEISDPKNKAESDLYLRQLEYENKVESVYGKGVQLVIPAPGFVVKTADKTTGRKARSPSPVQPWSPRALEPSSPRALEPSSHRAIEPWALNLEPQTVTIIPSNLMS
jgi:hypothetical protein